MSIKPDELQVIISYKQLTELLGAAQGLQALNSKLDYLLAQLDAIKSTQVECMDRIGELNRLIQF